jgi:hypothetical protein
MKKTVSSRSKSATASGKRRSTLEERGIDMGILVIVKREMEEIGRYQIEMKALPIVPRTGDVIDVLQMDDREMQAGNVGILCTVSRVMVMSSAIVVVCESDMNSDMHAHRFVGQLLQRGYELVCYEEFRESEDYSNN